MFSLFFFFPFFFNFVFFSHVAQKVVINQSQQDLAKSGYKKKIKNK
jgi:hypothetical protein